jgi:hypothetical protein
MKPQRQRRHDTLLMGSSTRGQMAVDHAIAPFDRVAREMDATWGIDRLPSLVSPETAAKYGRTIASLNEAIEAADEFRAADRAQACIRGMAAMDAEARAAGHTPPSSGVLVCDDGEAPWGLLPDHTLWKQATEEYPGMRIYTLRELGVLIKAAEDGYPGLADVRDAIPGVEIKRMAQGKRENLDDEIPF